MIRYFWVFVAGLIGFSLPLQARTISHYTDTDVSQCRVVDQAREGEGEWITFRCRGYGGMDVYISEADLRFSVGYGRSGQNQKSFSQRLAPFNTIGKKMEWRVEDGRVIATILRYYTETGSGGRKGQILVVTKVDGDRACHMAYVDALANHGANEMAQDAADRLAHSFSCETDSPIHVGERGVSPF